jgi:hypothetical protein
MRIKALPLSQSKQEKRTEGVITTQRGKDSWNQRPQTSGSSTPPLTVPPRMLARLHAHHHRPTFPLQRTHRRHYHQQHHPPSLALVASCHLLHHRHSAPEHHLTYCSPIKLPHQLPQLPSQAKHTPDKIPSAKLQATLFSHSLAPKITMLSDSWVEDCCTWFIVFGFLLCMMVIHFDRIL